MLTVSSLAPNTSLSWTQALAMAEANVTPKDRNYALARLIVLAPFGTDAPRWYQIFDLIDDDHVTYSVLSAFVKKMPKGLHLSRAAFGKLNALFDKKGCRIQLDASAPQPAPAASAPEPVVEVAAAPAKPKAAKKKAKAPNVRASADNKGFDNLETLLNAAKAPKKPKPKSRPVVKTEPEHVAMM